MVAIPKEWDEKFVLRYIQRCIVEDKGIPMFMKKIFGSPLPKGHVILACRDMDNQDILRSYHLYNVPEYIERILREYPKDNYPEWRKIYEELLSKYLEEATDKYNRLISYLKEQRHI